MSRDHLDQELSRALARRAAVGEREFDAQDLARFARGLRLELCRAVLTESGARLVAWQASDDHDELVLHVTALWTRRTVRVRIAARPVDQRALDRLAARIRAAGDAEGLMIAAHGLSEACRPGAIVRLVEPDELIERLRRSPWIAWPGRKPELVARFTSAQQLAQATASVDVVGIRWLPTLALDELPAEIADVQEAPQTVLERLAFRVLTTSLRFRGERLAASAHAARLPDAVLRWPAGNTAHDAALLASVAAADGYTMDAGDEQRLEAAIDAARNAAFGAAHELSFLIVLSSDFPGPRGRGHPYHARAEALAQRAGIMLVYLRAVDLARLAVTVEGSEMTPAAREALPWSEVLSLGVPRFEDLQRLLRS